MRGGRLQKNLGRSAPDGDEARRPGTLLEFANIRAHLLGKIHLVLAFFHVVPVELLYVVAVKNGRTRLDGAQEWLDLIQEIMLEHASFADRGVHIVFERIPASENQIVQSRDGH